MHDQLLEFFQARNDEVDFAFGELNTRSGSLASLGILHLSLQHRIQQD